VNVVVPCALPVVAALKTVPVTGTHCRPSSSEHGPQARTNPHASAKWRA